MTTTNKNEQLNIPQNIDIDKLIISYNELFDDFLIYCPWDNKLYITAIGDFSMGFGERPFLQAALNKIKKKYGDTIPSVLIETKPIPDLSAPIYRRHGKKQVKLNVLHMPLSKDLEIFFEQIPFSAINWEDMAGDENSSRNVNEPELWRPIHQRTSKF